MDKRAKYVSCAQGDFGDDGSVRLKRQNIFEFVSEFAELAVAASSRVSLERMHDAAQAARGFSVVGGFFQTQRFLVQLFHEFSRALEEQFAQFAHPVVWGIRHYLTSMR